MKEAPLYNDAIQLARWICANLRADAPVGRRVHHAALDLVEHVTLALHGLDREVEVDLADRAAARLRALLRLAFELDLLVEAGLLHAAAMLDRIGRQIGGWRRHLDGGNL
ncbi:hypothetical protein L6R50_12030 [Myxococcota bacterium]|nr:hypothetical protein [Myxococcota bacterium]